MHRGRSLRCGLSFRILRPCRIWLAESDPTSGGSYIFQKRRQFTLIHRKRGQTVFFIYNLHPVSVPPSCYSIEPMPHFGTLHEFPHGRKRDRGGTISGEREDVASSMVVSTLDIESILLFSQLRGRSTEGFSLQKSHP